MKAMNQAEVEKYVLSFPNAVREYPFGEGLAVYKVGGEIFAIIKEGKNPVQISLKCDPLLSKVLRQRYESVMPGDHLHKKYWNTLVLSGQLNWQEVQDLIRHSHDLVVAQLTPKIS
jgi:predicted DNA-binding protein (MmcQ/YjbR family)